MEKAPAIRRRGHKVIKELDIEDYPKIQALWKLAGLFWRPDGRDHPKRILTQMKRKNIFFLGVVENSDLLGVIMVSHDG